MFGVLELSSGTEGGTGVDAEQFIHTGHRKQQNTLGCISGAFLWIQFAGVNGSVWCERENRFPAVQSLAHRAPGWRGEVLDSQKEGQAHLPG